MSRRTASGMPICSNDKNWLGMRRSTIPMKPFCLKTAHAEASVAPEGDGEVGAALFCILLAAIGRDALIRAVVSSLSSVWCRGGAYGRGGE